MLPAVTVPAIAKHTATVIFLHGLGDSGNGWSDIAKMYGNMSHIKWIFPHAPQIPITVNGGMRMPGWYDIVSLDRIQAKQDKQGLLKSRDQIQELIQNEVDHGISPSRIIVGGFSQGGAMSLLTGLTIKKKLAGIVALSGYLPLSEEIDTLRCTENQQTPIFMGHGELDPVVQYSYGKGSATALKDKGYSLEFKSYPGMQHSACDQEFQDLARFLSNNLPQ